MLKRFGGSFVTYFKSFLGYKIVRYPPVDLNSVALCSVVFYNVEIERIELRLLRLRVCTWFRGFEMLLLLSTLLPRYYLFSNVMVQSMICCVQLHGEQLLLSAVSEGGECRHIMG